MPCERFTDERIQPFRTEEVLRNISWLGDAFTPFYTNQLPLPRWTIPEENLHPVASGYEMELSVWTNAAVQDSANQVYIIVAGAEDTFPIAIFFDGFFDGTGCDLTADFRTKRFTALEWNQMVETQAAPGVGLTILAAIGPSAGEFDCQGGSSIQIQLDWTFVDGTTTEDIEVKAWNEDECQNIVFGWGQRADSEQHQQGHPHLPWKTNPNRPELFSLHTNRLNDRAHGQEEEPCTHSYATHILDRRGYGVGILCTENQSGYEIGASYNHYAYPFVRYDNTPYEDGDNLGRVVKNGYGGFMAGITGPSWYEVVLASRSVTCLPPRI